VLAVSGLSDLMQTTVYGDEVDNGKPAPDIYLRALRDIGVAPEYAVGVEDSGNGIRSLAAAGMGVIAAPMPGFAPAPDIVALAGVRVASMVDFELVHVERAAQRRRTMPPR
jgi:mannitol-1-/sugar-/sorbitol-6-/2-deoxyglucose-6-phosphatase